MCATARSGNRVPRHAQGSHARHVRSLRKADLIGKSDPVCHCAVRNFGLHEPWKQLGHTGALPAVKP